jgi:dynactin complex subunit
VSWQQQHRFFPNPFLLWIPLLIQISVTSGSNDQSLIGLKHFQKSATCSPKERAVVIAKTQKAVFVSPTNDSVVGGNFFQHMLP